MYTPNKKLAWLAEKTNHDWVDVYLLLKKTGDFPAILMLDPPEQKTDLKLHILGFMKNWANFCQGSRHQMSKAKVRAPKGCLGFI